MTQREMLLQQADLLEEMSKRMNFPSFLQDLAQKYQMPVEVLREGIAFVAEKTNRSFWEVAIIGDLFHEEIEKRIENEKRDCQKASYRKSGV